MAEQERPDGVNVQVLLRCRPLSDREIVDRTPQAIVCSDVQREVTLIQNAGGKQMSKVFRFDKVFGPDSTQERLYKQAIIPIVNEVMDGFNCTIFAYGQTGTGKTYTMEGGPRQSNDGRKLSAEAGVIPRAIRQIFDTLESGDLDSAVKVSFLELYNEELTDLLSSETDTPSQGPSGPGNKNTDSGKPLRLLEDRSGVVVQNLEEVSVTSAVEIYQDKNPDSGKSIRLLEDCSRVVVQNLEEVSVTSAVEIYQIAASGESIRLLEDRSGVVVQNLEEVSVTSAVEIYQYADSGKPLRLLEDRSGVVVQNLEEVIVTGAVDIDQESFKKDRREVVVQNLEEVRVTSAVEIYQVLDRGTVKRRTAATLLNNRSSRSHSIFSITIHLKETTPEGEDVIKVGKLNLVDLAGSENISRSGAKDSRAREAGSINQSLLTLGRVITALVEHSGHIPYRDSKLTRLLRDSLGGRTKTCIIATIAPTVQCQEETISTLDYAHRAKNIKNKPEVNQKISKTALIKDMASEIEKLKLDLMDSVKNLKSELEKITTLIPIATPLQPPLLHPLQQPQLPPRVAAGAAPGPPPDRARKPSPTPNAHPAHPHTDVASPSPQGERSDASVMGWRRGGEGHHRESAPEVSHGHPTGPTPRSAAPHGNDKNNPNAETRRAPGGPEPGRPQLHPEPEQANSTPD
eukprot:gene27766-7406_t